MLKVEPNVDLFSQDNNSGQSDPYVLFLLRQATHKNFFKNVSHGMFHALMSFKGVLHPWALFLKTLCIFSKNKEVLDKVSHGSGQKCSKELKNRSFTSVEAIVVKLQWKMCNNQYFPCFEP